MKRKSNRANRRSRRGRRNRKGRRSSRNKHSRRRRERRSPYPRVPGVPQGQSPRETPPHYFWRRLSRSIQSKGSTEGEIHSQATFIHPHAFHPFTIGTQTMPHPLASTQALHPFAARYRVMPHPLPYIRAPNQVIHPSHASSQATHTHTSPYTQQNLIHPLHTRLNSKPHPETSTHTQRQSLHNPHTHSHPQSPTYTQKNPSHTTHTNPNNIPTPLASTRTLHRITAPHTHLQTHSNPQTTNEVKYQSPLESTHSRHVRESPRHRQVHPQEGEFTHPQAGVDISAPRFLHGARQGRGGDQAQRKQERERNQLLKECSKTQSWRKLAGRRYGPVMVSLRNHRKLAFLLGDVDLSLVVTRSRSSHGQHFLGVYLERHSLLSPNTTGIIDSDTHVGD
ncbi:hypothetical protein E2C01_067932 [Portunus trituberculatus]|uniref:Uncharacterized protein n=1 Tax=Portunus trituberculatus TaxID=210409 RepID=A0A5B7HWI7_PORTR|nr:hypothetical protein [Portunus trituberculatus]